MPRRRPGRTRSTGKDTMRRLYIFLILCVLASSGVSEARQAAPAAPAGAQPAVRVPPAGSGPVIRFLQLKFHPVDESIIDPQTYLRDVLTRLPTLTNHQIKDVTPEAWAGTRSSPSQRQAA